MFIKFINFFIEKRNNNIEVLKSLYYFSTSIFKYAEILTLILERKKSKVSSFFFISSNINIYINLSLIFHLSHDLCYIFLLVRFKKFTTFLFLTISHILFLILLYASNLFFRLIYTFLTLSINHTFCPLFSHFS